MPLKSRIRQIQRAFPAALDRAVETTARQIKATRDDLVHVDTGALKASGKVERLEPGVWEVSEGEGLPDARAAYEEFGTDKHGPHPHFIPAAERHRGDLERNVEKEAKEALK